jgi:hypothetical protein
LFSETQAVLVLIGLVIVWGVYWLVLGRLLRRGLSALLCVPIVRGRSAWRIDLDKPPQWKAVVVGVIDLAYGVGGALGCFLSLVWLAGRAIMRAP